MIHVLFACHVGPGIGLGHLKRSLVAAKSLKKKLNVEIDFIIAGESIEIDFPRDFNIIFTNENQDLETAIEKSIQKNNYNHAMSCVRRPTFIRPSISWVLVKLRT